jgi:hypothetical protein
MAVEADFASEGSMAVVLGVRHCGSKSEARAGTARWLLLLALA